MESQAVSCLGRVQFVADRRLRGDLLGQQPSEFLGDQFLVEAVNRLAPVQPVLPRFDGARVATSNSSTLFDAPAGPRTPPEADRSAGIDGVINCDTIVTVPLERLEPEPVTTLDLTQRLELDRTLRWSLDILG